MAAAAAAKLRSDALAEFIADFERQHGALTPEELTRLARLLKAVDTVPADDRLGREAGVLLGHTDRSDAVDALVVSVARSGDRIITSDPADIQELVDASGRSIPVVTC